MVPQAPSMGSTTTRRLVTFRPSHGIRSMLLLGATSVMLVEAHGYWERGVVKGPWLSFGVRLLQEQRQEEGIWDRNGFWVLNA